MSEAEAPAASFSGTLEALAGLLPAASAGLSLESLMLFSDILATVSISASQSDFDEAARRVGNARRELSAAIAAARFAIEMERSDVG